MSQDPANNAAFIAPAIEKKLQAALHDLLTGSSLKGFSSTAEDLAALEATIASARAALDGAAEMALGLARARQRNLQDYRDIHFISLGSNCFARAVATRWGLKRSAALGEQTHPFDIAIHRLATIETLIRTDFEGYLDPANLSYLADKGYVANTKLGATYNHERGESFAADGFALLISKYAARIENFRRDVAAAEKLVFMVYTTHWNAGTKRGIERIHDALLATYPQKNFALATLVGMRTDDQDPLAPLPGPERPRLGVVIERLPFAGYAWHSAQHCFRQDGHAYEARMMAGLRRIADGIFGPRTGVLQAEAVMS